MQNNNLKEAEAQMYKDGWKKVLVKYTDGTNSVVYASLRGFEAIKNSDCDFVVLGK